MKYQLQEFDDSWKSSVAGRLAENQFAASYVGHVRQVLETTPKPRLAISEDEGSFLFIVPEVVRGEGGLQYMFCLHSEFYLIRLYGLFGPSAEVVVQPLRRDVDVSSECRSALRSALLVFDRFGDGENELTEIIFRS